jgi:hypothetical protein
MGWISMIRIHEDSDGTDFVSLVPEEEVTVEDFVEEKISELNAKY